MKEQIYTIPIIDGFTEGGECPFCNMYHKLDKDSVEYMLGPSYMEEDIRAETDASGFCERHYRAMFAEQNRLGLALMTFTHLQKIIADMNHLYPSAADEKKGGLFSRKKNNEQVGGKYAAGSKPAANGKLAAYINKLEDDCYICKRIDTFFSQYMNSYFHLWKQGGDIIDLTSESQGFCLPHFSMIVSLGASALDKDEYKHLLDAIMPLQKEQLSRISEELDWFIKKFDYRFADEPWKNSKDSLPRAIQKISSIARFN